MGFWRRPALGLIALAALAGAPVLGAVCAGLCAPHGGFVAAPHAAAACHESPVSEAPTLAQADPDACGGHDQTAHDPATLRSSARAGATALPGALTASPAPAVQRPAAAGLRTRGLREAAPSPPRSPLILRI